MEYFTILQYAIFASIGAFFVVLNTWVRTWLFQLIIEIWLNATMWLSIAMMLHSVYENKMFNSWLALALWSFGYKTSSKIVKKLIDKFLKF